MLYLEDYLEMIEHLPEELRDRFTSMREMDLQVQNTTESLEKRVKTFFSNAKEMKDEERDGQYSEIKKAYNKALEDADEKVQLANHMHDLVSMYLRRLEQECHKFKMELEADNAGITEILEKRSEELDIPPTNSSQKENRYSVVISRPSSSSSSERKRESSTPEQKRHSSVEKVVADVRPIASFPQPSVSASSAPPTVNYSLSHMGVGGTAIAAAATQAIAATQQMQQGRRTASLKASYDAINSVVGGMSITHTHDLGISKELAGAAQTAIAAIQDTSKKNKKKSSTSSSSAQALIPINPQLSLQIPTEGPSSRNDTSYDPNEPRYCICNEVAYGGMVACDNKNCPHEWFHYPCVGITDPPKGSWYCPQCLIAKKRRGSRKKKGHMVIEERNQQVN